MKDFWGLFSSVYRKVKFKTLKCLPCFSVHDEGIQMFLAVLHVSVLLECKLLGNHHVRTMCTVCYIWCLFSLLHQTGQNKMSTEYCYSKLAVVCFLINSLQSQQSFCFFLGLRAVWVISLMQLWPNQARLTRCLSEWIYIHTEMDKSHIRVV